MDKYKDVCQHLKVIEFFNIFVDSHALSIVMTGNHLEYRISVFYVSNNHY